MVCEGDLNIGSVAPGDSTAVTIKGPPNVIRLLDVNGTIAIGFNNRGDMSLDQSATAECDLLLVGGQSAVATGELRVLDADLHVTGNAQIGVGAGRGSMLIQPECVMSIGGTMTVGGPGGGDVTVNGFIVGPGLVKAVPGGVMNGNGRIIARKVENGGTIAPNLSPGTLTIEGDYEQLEDGVLEIEVAGLESGQFDVLHVTGNATLAGSVDLKFIDGFVPQPGFAVDFVVVDGTVTGKLTGDKLVDVPSSDITDGTSNTIAVAEVQWDVTPEGTCRLTVTDVQPVDDSAQDIPGCGAGLCGAGVVPMFPLTFAGLCILKGRRGRPGHLRPKASRPS
jgi:hypothetical protein